VLRGAAYLAAGVVVLVLLFTGAAPFAIFAALWYGCIRVISAAPYEEHWEYSRFFLALLIAWTADWVLYRNVAGTNVLHHYPSIASAIVVVSIAFAYYIWRSLKQFLDARSGSMENPLRYALGFFLALFVMLSVASPLLDRYLPSYWHQVWNAERFYSDSDSR
jgi:hypothetical protein